MWLIHIDTWNYPDPQKIIDLVPADIRPFVVMNLSLSINHNEEDKFMRLGDGYETANSWIRVCAENGMWTTIQQASGGYNHFGDDDLAVYEHFFRSYPNFVGFNYAEQFWGFNDAPLSPPWIDRISHFAKLLELCNQYGGYLVVSWCGNQWSPSINPMAMMKRNAAFEQAARLYTENFILCEKYTQQGYQHDMESLCLGAYLSGYSGQYGIRYDDTGWTDANGDAANFSSATNGAPHLEHVMLTGQTVIDGPELIWTECFRGLSNGPTTDGFTMRRWGTFPQFDNMSVDIFRKILDGTVRIPTRQEVIDRTKVVIVNDVNSGNDNAVYSTPQSLFDGLYLMDGYGAYENNKTFFKKTGRYPTVPTVYRLDDDLAQSFQVQVNKSAYSARWPSTNSKVAEFNSLFPSEYTGDIYAGRHENGWVVYNPHKTNQIATGTIPFKYNTCDSMELSLTQYSSGVVKEYADQVTFYLTNYDSDDTSLRTDTIKIHGSSEQPTWTYADRGSQPANVTSSWSGGILTLNVAHNGPLDITVNCAGTATGRLTDFTPATLVVPDPPLDYTGPRQYEGECFDFKNINGIDSNAAPGSIVGFTGQGFLRFGTSSSAAVRDRVRVLHSGSYRLETRYAVTGSSVSSIDLYVNGTKVADPVFTQTPTLSDWAVQTQMITLGAGDNTVEYRAAGSAPSSLYFDSIVLTPTTFGSGVVIQENQTGFAGVDGSIGNGQPGYTGDGFADSDDMAGAGIDWWLDYPEQGVGALTFRYASLEDRVADLFVNGVKVAANIPFPSTGSLSTWEFAAANGAVPAGLSKVRLQAVSSSGLPNIDYLGVGGESETESIGPVADVYVRDGGSADTNFGTSDQLVAKYDASPNSGFTRFSHLKFDVSGLTDVQNATLKLVPFQVDGGTTLNFDRLDGDAWSETGMTFNNRPTETGTPVASITGFIVGQQTEVDLTEAVRVEAAGDGILSLRISNDSWNFIGFHSRESPTAAFRPVLEYSIAVPTVSPGAVKLADLKLDDGTGTTADDSTGNGWDGTLVSGPTWVVGSEARINGALALGGGSHLTLPAGLVSDVGNFTVSFWLKPGTITDEARVFDFSSGDPQNGIHFTPRTASGVARFSIIVNGTEQTLETPSAAHFTTGTWTHVTVSLSGNTARLFINGAPMADNEAMTLRPSDLGSTTDNLIGGSTVPSIPFLDGVVDEFRIYEGSMSATTINLLANPPATPTDVVAMPTGSRVDLSWSPSTGANSYTIKRSTTAGGPFASIGSTDGSSFADTSVANDTTFFYTISAGNGTSESSASAPVSATPSPLHLQLRFDEPGGMTATDSSGNGRNGTLVNGPLRAPGQSGNAVVLDGSNDHVTLPGGSLDGLGSCTVSSWVKLDTLSDWARLFDFGTGPGVNMFLAPRSNANAVRFAITTSGAGGEQQVNGSAPLPTGVWTHVAVALDGTTGRLFVNGTEVGSNPVTLTPSSLGASTNNYIGRSQYADPYLDGMVDDFRIHNHAMDEEEVRALMSPPPPVPVSLQATAVSATRIDLSWAASTDAVSYTIQRSTTAGEPYESEFPNVTSTSFTDTTGLMAGTRYHYIVKAVNAGGESAASGEASAAPSAQFTSEQLRAPEIVMAGGNASITATDSVIGHLYQLQHSDDLDPGAWQNHGPALTGDGGPLMFSMPVDPEETHLFYRLLITRP